MRPKPIGPDSLEADAVVPQCLDNQYVSDHVFSKMLRENLDYADKDILRLRENDFKTEFIRSLVYSSQVIIQRAFLKNSDFLYKNYLPGDGKNLRAFAELLRSKAVVPFLFKESSLRDQLTFDLSKEGDRAANALLDEAGAEATCVRLAIDDANNDIAAESMATEFGTGLTRLQHMSGSQRNAMASELFAEPQRLQQEGVWKKFDAAVDKLAKYAFTKDGLLRKESSDSRLTREHVYRDNFIVKKKKAKRDETNVVLGRFRKPDDKNPFLLELKKYVDLVYNVNLPDHLKRYTFTPVNMPSRMALQDAPRKGYSHEQVSNIVSNRDALDSIRRTFMAHTQQAMSLPLLRDLSVSDVLEIRGLPEWTAFKESQAFILAHPTKCLDRLEQFQMDFDEFQHSLSKWYNAKYERRRTEERYCSYISFALNLAGKLIVANSSIDPLGRALITSVSDWAVDNIPKKVRGYAAKLIVGVYDKGKERLDSQRTYSVELMQTNQQLMQDDVIELLNSIRQSTEADMPAPSSKLADQGVQ